MSLGPIVAPPFVCRQRAWECAWMLREVGGDRLPLAERVAVEVVTRMMPDRLGWAECGAMLRLYGETFDVRV